MSYDGTRQLAHSEGEYIYPENAGWYWLYFDPTKLDAENRDFLSIVGIVLWLISMYQLSNILRKPSIFQKVLIYIILGIAGILIAFAVGLMAGVSLFASIRGETGAIFGLGLGVIVAIIVAYAISLAAFYFYKEAYDILAQATAHKLFKIVGLLMFIGAITTILFGLGLLLIIVGYIVLAVAFFTAPSEVEVQGT